MNTKTDICLNAEKCPLFLGLLAGKETFTNFYKSTFCEAGVKKYKKCKRYIIKEMYGKCPPDLLPNTSLSIEQIVKKYDYDTATVTK